jgi:alpha-methylacyl-CoA racemase
MPGALAGVRIIEMAGLGPAPFAGMMLADHGAEVIRVQRPRGGAAPPGPEPDTDILLRSRRVLRVDLKHPEGPGVVRALARSADGLIEGFRPGVMERLGLGPHALLAERPSLVYGRMTGWGQTGPLAQAAGHDINYIALAGALHGFGRPGGKPTPPANLVGDFGGGGMLLAFGMLAGILRARADGTGQVIDCAMLDGTALLQGMTYSLLAAGRWRDGRGANLLDGGAPYYDTYETADGLFVAVGALEPQFFALLLEQAGLSGRPEFARQSDEASWPDQRRLLTEVFARRTRAEWCALMEGTDACFAPVLSLAEAPAHPHTAARGTFTHRAGYAEPAPAPRFSRTPAATPADARRDDPFAVLTAAGLPADEARRLQALGVCG